MILVEVSEPALDDWIDAADWYDEHARPGVGDRFRKAVRRQLDEIGERPTSFPLTSGVYRRALVAGFPYVIHFRIETDRVFVRAILHGSRSPQSVRRRLSDQ